MMSPKADSADTSVGRCATEIRSMILSGVLLPGQKVHQGELAQQLNVSRIPVHAALTALQSEGLLDHKPNSGYTVARFSSDELAQIYLMRRVLETELLRSIDLAAVDAGELAAINDELDTISAREDLGGYQETNLRFHFALFGHSPLGLVRSEVARLWYRSGYYRSLRLHLSDAAPSVHDDHVRIIEAVRTRDIEALVRASDLHRGSTTESLAGEHLHVGPPAPDATRSA